MKKDKRVVDIHNKLEEKMRNLYYKPLIDEIWADIKKVEARKRKSVSPIKNASSPDVL